MCQSHRPYVGPTVVYDKASADWYAERGWMVTEYRAAKDAAWDAARAVVYERDVFARALTLAVASPGLREAYVRQAKDALARERGPGKTRRDNRNGYKRKVRG